MQYEKINTKYKHINTNHTMQSEMGPSAYLSVLMTVHNYSTQYNTEQFRIQ